MVIPDILANAGGVVVSYFEWSQNLSNDAWPEEKVLERLEQIMTTAFNDVHALCSGSAAACARPLTSLRSNGSCMPSAFAEISDSE